MSEKIRIILQRCVAASQNDARALSHNGLGTLGTYNAIQCATAIAFGNF